MAKGIRLMAQEKDNPRTVSIPCAFCLAPCAFLQTQDLRGFTEQIH
ncbi:MAG: hypothetical protein K8R45_12775 [Desulfobacterales bacterium]|nr:hypothetical protein [Desulfobacterales bacterium]